MVAVVVASAASIGVLAFAAMLVWTEFRSHWPQILAALHDAPKAVPLVDPTPPAVLRPVVIRRPAVRRSPISLAA